MSESKRLSLRRCVVYNAAHDYVVYLRGVMGIPSDMSAAARRHLQAAECLIQTGRDNDVAGYLYGLAAECAVKAMMLDANIRDEDLLYRHFPELRTGLRDFQRGRNCKTLNRFIDDDDFMNEWSVKMRYAPNGQFSHRIENWRWQARDIVSAVGT